MFRDRRNATNTMKLLEQIGELILFVALPITSIIIGTGLIWAFTNH